MRRQQYNPNQLRRKKRHKKLDNHFLVVKKLPHINRKWWQRYRRELKKKNAR